MTEIYIPMNIDVGRTYKGFEGLVRFAYAEGAGAAGLDSWVDILPYWDTIVTVVE